jgi:hypothetical protein
LIGEYVAAFLTGLSVLAIRSTLSNVFCRCWQLRYTAGYGLAPGARALKSRGCALRYRTPGVPEQVPPKKPPAKKSVRLGAADRMRQRDELLRLIGASAGARRIR